jgi:hypothetical protein
VAAVVRYGGRRHHHHYKSPYNIRDKKNPEQHGCSRFDWLRILVSVVDKINLGLALEFWNMAWCAADEPDVAGLQIDVTWQSSSDVYRCMANQLSLTM